MFLNWMWKKGRWITLLLQPYHPLLRLGWGLDTDDLLNACSINLLNEVSMCTNNGSTDRKHYGYKEFIVYYEV